ncbi:uncharacterized protein LOC133173274 [Saccostrea echinata]|uniref:uncharacterized protein LOC133173274 n=1 Tax=Saccostrea echinata TaxID=191078 RepID=UPI002A7EA770|nr:uncharacterized protein LOC133173274 [Saccostrea echinata]
MGTTHRITKDFHRLARTIESFSDGQAKVVLGNDDENDRVETIFRFEVDIMPNGGPYQGGTFRFEFCVENECQWPREPPIIRCLTDIYHPNIDHLDRDNCSNVCVSVLDRGMWSYQFDFETCVQALLFLFYEPNFDDALSPICCSDEDFQELVQISLKGGTIDGFQFSPNIGRINNVLQEIT